MTPEEVKAQLAAALKSVIGDMNNDNEREFVAQSLGALADMIRGGVIHGFDWKWTQGTGVIDATNLHKPKVPANFITLQFNIGEIDADPAAKEG